MIFNEITTLQIYLQEHEIRAFHDIGILHIDK